MAKKNELEEQVAKLSALVEEMRTRISGLEGGHGRPAGTDAPRSRRDMLRLGGAAALGAVGAAAMRAVPAAAANGDPVLAGQTVVSTAPTTVSGAAAAAQVLAAKQSDFPGVAAGAFSGALQGLGGLSGTVAPFAEGVDGFASGATAFGVYGLTDSGTGVTGESSTGISLYARGTGRLRQDPGSVAKPTHVPNAMEQARDADGALWLSDSNGRWRRASTFEVFPNGRRVYGTGVAIPKGTVVTVDATMKIASAGGGVSGLPAGATAAWCAVQSFEPAVLSIYPAGSPDPGVGTFGVMGTAGISIQIIYMMVPLNAAGQFTFKNMKTTARIFFDVWGFLTQSFA